MVDISVKTWRKNGVEVIDFNIFKAINEIHKHINKSTKNFVIDDVKKLSKARSKLFNNQYSI